MTLEEYASELAAVRERIDALYAAAPTPALASCLRTMAETALVAHGYADPLGVEIAPAAYADDLTPTGGDA
ncbi:MAG: hypothetical protein QOI62_3902 [Solirubrobacteraceae bacterium]|jgi:hypothetical protein|nr:hypothetical protein [Solirubrobacteraceae bacterium]MEA2360642.1 hypothetical protein [Solirubrobacteraceae bacterium]MEA2394978.1 hypothetical protein [Solirubrobacteraceae bacterium]